jgi:DNA-binding response OmpR family regulator
MPGMSGWDTYNRIRGISNIHKVPIAIITTSEDPENRDRAQKLGAVDYIRKPTNREELLEKVRKLI